MPDSFDVIVIGGGIVGASLGYELASSGARTLLVDRHHTGRATDAGAGILSPETIAVDDDAWWSLAIAAGEHSRELVAALDDGGAADTGYAECGSLRIAFREHDDELFDATAKLIMRRSGDVVTRVDEADARAMCPALGPIRAALHNPRAARVDGRMMTRAVLAGARRRGLFRRTGMVHGIVCDGGRVGAIETERERIACGAAVVAGGAWTPALGAQLGVELPVAPVRGQIVHLDVDGRDTGGWPILQPVLSYYVVPWPGGRLGVGGTMEPEAGFDARSTVVGIQGLLSEAMQLAPGLRDAAFAEVRVGLRPVSIDDAPILGPVPGVEGAFVATGHGANGLLLGPYTAQLVARSMLGEEVPQLAPFTADRFT